MSELERIDLDRKFCVYHHGGKWFAIRDSSPYFCIEGESIEYVARLAKEALSFAKQTLDKE